MKIEATFVRSAATAADLPHDGLPEVALVGRWNVGKSSLDTNALVRQRIARTSAAPGKTRLANVYRLSRGSRTARSASPDASGGDSASFYLPGYGYARAPKDRGGAISSEAARQASREEFEEIVRAVFARHRPDCCWSTRGTRASTPTAPRGDGFGGRGTGRRRGHEDRQAGTRRTDPRQREFESVFETSVLPVSAATGEGLDELWKLIDRLTEQPHTRQPPPQRRPPPGAQRQRRRPPPEKIELLRRSRT